ncbi:MAG: RNA polymerase sigma factor [Clostridiales bacterium]|nr:RNA polymerase sigma factor [Clostridiales bacterium]
MAITEQQLTELYYEYADMVYRVCYTWLRGHKADTEDAVQTTFLNVLRSGGLPAKVRNPKAWLITCAVNSCKNMLGRSHRRDEELTDRHAYRDQRDETLELILALPKPMRLSIYLHYYEGYTAKEIGRMLDKSESTVWGYLSRGRNDLKRQLTEAM